MSIYIYSFTAVLNSQLNLHIQSFIKEKNHIVSIQCTRMGCPVVSHLAVN